MKLRSLTRSDKMETKCDIDAMGSEALKQKLLDVHDVAARAELVQQVADAMRSALRATAFVVHPKTS